MTTQRKSAPRETPVKGRPRANAPRRLSDSLLSAAKSQLHRKGHLEITSREIAQAAGANVAMINYYFNGKDGLFTELVDAISIEAGERLRDIERDIDHGIGDPLERMVRSQVQAVQGHADVLAVIFIELLRPDSHIKRLYAEHSKLRGWNLLKRVESILAKLIARNGGGTPPDPATAAWTFTSLVYGPLLIGSIWEANGGSTTKPGSEEWIRHVTAVMRKTLSSG